MDRRFTDAAHDSGVAPTCRDPHGPGTRETKAAQARETTPKGVAHLVKEALAKVVESGIDAGAEAGAGWLTERGVAWATKLPGIGAGLAQAAIGPGMALLGNYEIYAHAVEQGKELRAAHERDAINLAFVWTAAAALPHDYVERMGQDMKDVGGEHGGASKLLTRMMGDDKQWQATKRVACENVEIGQRAATALHIESRVALAARIKGDAGFAALYRNNLGFKHGVDSVVFEAMQPRAK